MPALNLDSLDDPLTFDGVSSFAGGQVSNTRANLLKPDQSAQLVNCDVQINGQLQTRRGSARIGDGVVNAATRVQGLAFYETSTNNYEVAVNNAKLYKFDGANWTNFAAAWSAADTAVKVKFAQGVNKLYFTDGVGGLYSWDGTTLVNVSTASGVANTEPPAGAHHPVWHTRRLVVIAGSAEPDSLYFSQFSDGAVWDRTKWSMRVSDDGSPATGLCPWTDFNLIVMKRHSLWIINCDPSFQVTDPGDTIAGFTKKVIHPTIGCLAPETACQVGSDVYMLTTQGVRSIARTLASQTQTDITDSLSYPIQDVMERINMNAIATANAFFWNNRYFLALPLDGATTPNYVAVYNVLTKSWHGLWIGWLPTCWAIRNVNTSVPRLMFGQSDGTVNEWLDYVQTTAEVAVTYQDAGVDISTTIVTRAMMFEEPISQKTGLNAEFEFNGSLASLSTQLILDGSMPIIYQTLETVSGDIVTLPVFVPFFLPTAGVKRRAFDLQAYGRWRELQFKLSTTKQKLVLRAIDASAFNESLELQH